MAANAIVLRGVPQLQAAIKRLPRAIAQKIMTKALNQALIPIRDQARANAPARPGSGLLRKSIDIFGRNFDGTFNRKYLNFQSQVRIGKVAAVSGYPPRRYPSSYAHLVEKGFRHVSGKQIQGVFFMKNAYDTRKAEAERIFISEARSGLYAAVTAARST